MALGISVYTKATMDEHQREFIGWLNERGHEGWEAVETDPDRDGIWTVFKRLLPDKKDYRLRRRI